MNASRNLNSDRYGASSRMYLIALNTDFFTVLPPLHARGVAIIYTLNDSLQLNRERLFIKNVVKISVDP